MILKIFDHEKSSGISVLQCVHEKCFNGWSRWLIMYIFCEIWPIVSKLINSSIGRYAIHALVAV